LGEKCRANERRGEGAENRNSVVFGGNETGTAVKVHKFCLGVTLCEKKKKQVKSICAWIIIDFLSLRLVQGWWNTRLMRLLRLRLEIEYG
jgi:hypothetical protein